MNAEQLKQRTKEFGVRVIRLVEELPRSKATEVLGRQLLRAGTAVGANYRAACRARSLADFVSKIGITEEEADEAHYWLEVLRETKLVEGQWLHALLIEADELVAIFAASGKTARRGSRRVRNRQSSIANPQYKQSAVRNPHSAIL